MRVFMKVVVIIVITVLGFASLPPGIIPTHAAPKSKQYVLMGKTGSLPANLEALVGASGGKVIRTVPEIGVAIVESAEPNFAEAASSIPGIEVAEDESIILAPQPSSLVVEGSESTSGRDPSDAKFFDVAQWNMRVIRADKAWKKELGDNRVEVAVLDTGIDYTHQELAGKVDMTKSKAFFKESGPLPPTLPKNFKAAEFVDFNGHGTHVAAIIAAEGISVAGVAPHVTLIAVKVGGRDGFAKWSTIMEAVVYAANVRADVINMSFGERLARNRKNTQKLIVGLTRAVQFAHDRGAILVASAGNEGINWDTNTGEIKLPAMIEGVLGASATGPFFGANPDALAVAPVNGVPLPYTDHGFTIVDFAAPGGSFTDYTVDPVTGNPAPGGMPVDAIISACSRFIERLAGNPNIFPCQSGKANIFLLGTSMSAAHVSGVAALIDSVKGGGLNGDQLFDILTKTAADRGAPGRDGFYGYGRVDALAGVECAQSPKKCGRAP